jgi:hypothetical protein
MEAKMLIYDQAKFSQDGKQWLSWLSILLMKFLVVIAAEQMINLQ